MRTRQLEQKIDTSASSGASGLSTYSEHARESPDLNLFTRATMKNDPPFSENFVYIIISKGVLARSLILLNFTHNCNTILFKKISYNIIINHMPSTAEKGKQFWNVLYLV